MENVYVASIVTANFEEQTMEHLLIVLLGHKSHIGVPLVVLVLAITIAVDL